MSVHAHLLSYTLKFLKFQNVNCAQPEDNWWGGSYKVSLMSSLTGVLRMSIDKKMFFPFE